MYYRQTEMANFGVGNCGAFAAAYYQWASEDKFVPIDPPDNSPLGTVNAIYNRDDVKLERMNPPGGIKLTDCYRESAKITNDTELAKSISGGKKTELDAVIKDLNKYSSPIGLRNYLLTLPNSNDKEFEIWMPTSEEANIQAFRKMLEYYGGEGAVKDGEINNTVLARQQCIACIELVYVQEKALSNLHYVLSFQDTVNNGILYINPWCGFTRERKDGGWEETYGVTDECVTFNFIPMGAGIVIWKKNL